MALGGIMNIASLVRQCQRALIACLLATGLLGGAPVHATSYSADQSDLWWVSSESGWGMQLVQRGSVIFATLFVYDAANRPVWYTATLTALSTTAWQGDLYATTGPYFGAATFDPATVALNKVGTMGWTSTGSTSGTLVYAVGGVAVTKEVTRQLLVFDNFSGRYAGALSWVSSCTGVHEDYADLTVTQVNQNVSVNWTTVASRDSCSFAGILSQAGQLGRVQGTFECFPVHDDGQFTFYELTVSAAWLSGRFTSVDEDNGCRNEGYFSAARRR
jgi:hypothetical protein